MGSVIFDMDGLLIDSERLFVDEWMAAAGRRGIAVRAEQLIPAIGLVGEACRQILSDAVGGQAQLLAIRSEVRERYASGLARPALRPGAHALLQHLHAKGVRCAVASSSNLAEIEQRLGEHDLLRFLQAWAGGDEVARSKPEPDVYQLAAHRLGVAAADCLAFEDSDHGAEAALAAGMRVVLVPDLKTPPADLLARCHHVSDTLVGLHDWTLVQLR
ncbi:MAG: HAD-IA family hydrolase [Xanthomonadales bacterium]|nr:HAD-IA family hydrolase [Xanthomonadales bacterium]